MAIMVTTLKNKAFMLIMSAALAISVPLTSCKLSEDDEESNNVNRIVYKFNYDSSINDFALNGDETKIEKSEISAETESSTEESKATAQKAYRVYNCSAWWLGAKLQADFLKPKTSYLIYVTMAHAANRANDLWLRFEYKDSDGNDQSSSFKSHYAEPRKFYTLGGTITTPESLTNSYIYMYSMEGDYYIADITVSEIPRNADKVCNGPALCTLADSFKLGTLIYTEALTDSETLKFMKKHFNIFSTGNYLFLDQNTCRCNTAEDMDTNPKIYTDEADKYYNTVKGTGAMLRGHALIHDGTSYDWLFREKYENDGSEVSPATLRLRLEHYIENVIKYYEENYPGMTYSYDVINEGLTGYYGEGYYDENDEYHVRKYWNTEHTSVNKFNTILGRDYFKLVFAYARTYCNKYNRNIKLFYNDYASFDLNAEHFVKVAAWLNNGEPLYDENGNEILSYTGERLCWDHLIDGVGIEGYYGIGMDGSDENSKVFYENGGLEMISDTGFVANTVRLYAASGLEINFTETTIANYYGDETSQKQQAELIGGYITLLKKLNKELSGAITVVDMWNVIDNPFILKNEYSYGLAGTHSGIVDYALQAKPSFYAMKNALQAN